VEVKALLRPILRGMRQRSGEPEDLPRRVAPRPPEAQDDTATQPPISAPDPISQPLPSIS
jgi:hypothetical protein